jgi:hypothetical protein
MHWKIQLCCIEGNIEQKTTLATKIAEDFNAKIRALCGQSLSTKVL